MTISGLKDHLEDLMKTQALIYEFFVFLALLVTSSTLKAESVYLTDYSSSADIRVYVTDYSSSADCILYISDYSSSADVRVYKTDYSSSADIRVYKTDYSSSADIRVYVTEYSSMAKGSCAYAAALLKK